MRRIAAFSLVLIVASQAFYNLVVTMYWMANRDYIAQELCVKRDEPENCCKGKCYLNDKLANAPEQPGSPDTPPVPTFKKAVEFAAPLPEFPTICHTDTATPEVTPRIPVSQSAHSTLLATGIFHPPSGATA